MPVVKPTRYIGRITWLGGTRSTEGLLWSEPSQNLQASFEGVAGEVHAGLTAPSCVRMSAQYPEGTTVRNTRQFSVLSAEEMAAIAAEMGLAVLNPSLLGATMVLEGIPDFSFIPPGSRLQAASGATLVVNLNNRPCTVPSRAIEKAHPGVGKRFKPAAVGRRGVVAWVEREGPLHLGDAIRLHIPDQRPWAHLSAALADERSPGDDD
jgi:hypothetical protein